MILDKTYLFIFWGNRHTPSKYLCKLDFKWLKHYIHGLKGFKRDLYGSYIAMLKCVTQKVLIEKRPVKVLHLRPDWDFYGDKTNPVRVSNETRPVKLLYLRPRKSRLRPLKWQNKTHWFLFIKRACTFLLTGTQRACIWCPLGPMLNMIPLFGLLNRTL